MASGNPDASDTPQVTGMNHEPQKVIMDNIEGDGLHNLSRKLTNQEVYYEW